MSPTARSLDCGELWGNCGETAVVFLEIGDQWNSIGAERPKRRLNYSKKSGSRPVPTTLSQTIEREHTSSYTGELNAIIHETDVSVPSSYMGELKSPTRRRRAT